MLRTAALGVGLGLVAMTGLAAASPAVASTLAPVADVVTGGAASDTLHEISSDAQTTLDAATAALTRARTANAEVAASGLTIATDDTIVDTAALRDQIEQLSEFGVIPTLLLPGVTEATAEVATDVSAEASALREELVTAEAKQAAEVAAKKAAAKARREKAAAAAKAKAAAEALARANTPEGAKSLARDMASSDYGWGDDQFSCLESLWSKESGWNYQANNPSSGAYGIPQSLPGSKMATVGDDWQTNAATQITWGLSYIDRAYGSPCAAWGHSQSTDWY